MKNLSTITCCLLLLLLVAAGAAFASQQVVFGVVAANTPGDGVTVGRVAAGSPAEQAGLQAEDRIVRINSQKITDKSTLKELMAQFAPGDVVRVGYQRQGKQRVALVELVARRTEAVAPAAAAAVSVDVPYEVSLQMSQARARIRIQLAQLPYRLKPASVKADLYELRHLAVSLQVNQPGWMQGQAGEAELEFADAAGYLLLHTADNALSLIVKDKDNRVLHQYPLDTPAQCRLLPSDIVHRLQAL